MKTEIEAKLKIDSFDQLTKKLDQLGAKFIEIQNQRDTYFDNLDTQMRTQDRCLRIRLEQTGSAKKVFITYKGPKQAGQYKSRQEIEFSIDSAKSAQQLFAALGYLPAITVEKQRSVWILDDCQIALDQVKNLGSFVEIEGPDEKKVSQAKNKLGLADLHHISDSYADLISKVQNKKSPRQED